MFVRLDCSAISGLWTAGEGCVRRHADEQTMFIPQVCLHAAAIIAAAYPPSVEAMVLGECRGWSEGRRQSLPGHSRDPRASDSRCQASLGSSVERRRQHCLESSCKRKAWPTERRARGRIGRIPRSGIMPQTKQTTPCTLVYARNMHMHRVPSALLSFGQYFHHSNTPNLARFSLPAPLPLKGRLV